MNQYTKGKWYVALNGQITVKTGQRYTPICQMPFHSAREVDRTPEADANAQLISVAPDMYEALKAAQEGTGDWRAMIDLALAKAEAE